jgi:hypothetical protein
MVAGPVLAINPVRAVSVFQLADERNKDTR